MKLANLILAFSLVGALAAVGCGKSQNDTPPPVNGIVNAGAGVVPIPAPGMGATVPVGHYQNGTSYDAPCPTGYTQTGAYCTQSTYGVQGCGSGWNGYACGQPSGFGCPYGTAWSPQYYGCISTTYGNYPGYQMSQTNYGYVYYYTNGAPVNGYYYNGYGWVRF